MTPDLRETPQLVLAMVGLPARGKTYTARKVARYLCWHGYQAQVFNVGNYRRERLGSQQDHSFFDPTNPSGVQARQAVASEALDDMLDWLGKGGEVGILDATHTTRKRRDHVLQRCEAAGIPVVFLEIRCDDPAIIDANVRETKLRSPDYVGVDPAEAVRDFRQRIAHYERAYEPLDDPEVPSISIADLGRRVVVNRIQGYLPGRLVTFLMNLHTSPRRLFFTRHGESTWNVQGRIGGDAPLSPRGEQYAHALARFVAEREATGPRMVVWTSTLHRTRATAAFLGHNPVSLRALDEIDAGRCDGLTYAEVAARMPEEYAARQRDKLRYRYPRGESYQDVIRRLDGVIVELERRREPVLVIAHQAVLRALYGYFMDRAPADVPHLEMPLHTVIELEPKAYGCEEVRHPLPL